MHVMVRTLILLRYCKCVRLQILSNTCVHTALVHLCPHTTPPALLFSETLKRYSGVPQDAQSTQRRHIVSTHKHSLCEFNQTYEFLTNTTPQTHKLITWEAGTTLCYNLPYLKNVAYNSCLIAAITLSGHRCHGGGGGGVMAVIAPVIVPLFLTDVVCRSCRHIVCGYI